jgi:hypothetical protein
MAAPDDLHEIVMRQVRIVTRSLRPRSDHRGMPDHTSSSPSEPVPAGAHSARVEPPPDTSRDLAAITAHRFTVPNVVPAHVVQATESSDW